LTIETTGHTTNVVEALRLSKEQKRRVLDEVPFTDMGMYCDNIYKLGYKVVFISILADCNLGVYRRKDTGERFAAVEFLHPLTDPDNWPGLISSELPHIGFTFTEKILRDFSENTNKNFINSLNSLLPKKLVPVIVKLSKIPLSTKVNQITKEQRAALVQLLKGMCVTVTGFRPVAEAIITSGGIDISQINPKTMESKLIGGLYFAGEVIDVDAYTGGFNLQIAFSTGRLAGLSAAEEIKNERGVYYE
jgi:hypothetical protein